MSYIKDKLKEKQHEIEARKAKEAEQAAKAAKKAAARQEKAAAKINPKREAKAKAKAAAKEAKALKIADNAITDVFNMLAQDLDLSVNALVKNDGKMTLAIGGANKMSDYFTSIGGLRFKNIEKLTPDMVTNNKAFQAYQKLMDEQDYDVNLLSTKAAHQLNDGKAVTGVATALGAAMLWTPLPPIQLAGGLMLLGATPSCTNALNRQNCAQIELQIKEKQPIPLLEYIPAEGDMSNLLSELNDAQAKEKVGLKTAAKDKKSVQQPIIK